MLNEKLELQDKNDKISENKEQLEEQIKKSEEEKKDNINNIKKEKSKNINSDNEIADKVRTMFESIKNFEQLKTEVFNMKKNYEDLNRITMKSLEEKRQNQIIQLQNKILDINKKLELLMGDIKLKDLDYYNNENDGKKAMNLADLNIHLKLFQNSKANITDLNQLNEEFDFKIKELSEKIRNLRISIFGIDKNENNKSNDFLFQKLSFTPKKEFDEFKTKSEEEFDKIWKEINNLRLILDDIKDNKTSYNDLEELKNVILQKTEDLFLNQNKKSINYTSTLKILQDNFKKLLKLLSDKEQYYEKNQYQMEKNSLGGGHSCASCENYIGDLKTEHKFVNWNKFPKKEKDNTEIFKRVQNGYSHLLQMINFDSNRNPHFSQNTNSINKVKQIYLLI